MRQVVLAQRDLDLHAGVGVAAQHLDDARDRLVLRRRLLDDLDDDHVAGLRGAALVLRHEQVLVDPPVLGDDERDAALVVETADDRVIGARQHFDDLALRPAAAIDTRAPRRRAIAVQHLVHLRLAQEEVGAAVVGDEKAVTVGMPLHGAGDEVELGGDAKLALAVHQQLAVALHCGDASEERVAGALVDRHRPRELCSGHRHARRLQRFENGDSRGQQLRIDVVAPAASLRRRFAFVDRSRSFPRRCDDLGRIRVRAFPARRGMLGHRAISWRAIFGGWGLL